MRDSLEVLRLAARTPVFVAIAAVAVVVIAFSVRDYVRCRDGGGAFVRGFVWYECVAAVKP